MPPKADQPPPIPTDLPGITAALQDGIPDPARAAAVLAALFAMDINILRKEEQGALQVAQLVQPLHLHTEDAVRAGALKVTARLLTLSPALQAAVVTATCAQECWAVVAEFGSKFPAYKVAARAMLIAEGEARASSAVGGKKPAAGKAAAAPPPDPEASLPGPGKVALDAALRILATMASLSAGTALDWLVSSHSTEPLAPLVLLLQHHSSRIQYRALHLMAQLGMVPSTHPRLLGCGAVAAIMDTAKTSQLGVIRVEALSALGALCSYFIGPAVPQAVETGGLELCLQLVVAPDTGVAQTAGAAAEAAAVAAAAAAEARPPSAAPAKGSAAAASAAANAAASSSFALDFSKPVACHPAELQLAALRLLVRLVSASQAVTEQLARLGALQVLVAMLPDAPPPPPPVGHPPPPPPPADRPISPTHTIFGALLSPREPMPAEAEVVQPQEQSEWASLLSSTSSLQPSSKLPNAQAQAIALTLMAHMLSIEALAGTMLEHSNSLQQAAQAAADAAAAAAAGVTPGSVPSPAPTSGQGTPVGPPDPIPIHEHLLQYFMLAPVYATPPAATLEAGKGKKEEPKKPAGKGKGVEDSAPKKLEPHLQPPFPVPIRAAALSALTQLARHPGYGALLAQHPAVKRLVKYLAQPAGPPQAPAAATPPAPTPPPAAPPSPTPPAKPGSGSTGASSPLPPQPAAPPPVPQPAPPPTIAEPQVLAELASLVQLLHAHVEKTDEERDEGSVGAAAAASPVPGASSEPALSLKLPQASSDDSLASTDGALTEQDVIAALKLLAASARMPLADSSARSAVAAAVLALPESAFIAPPRPPLPSPPPTPPPLPLATSLYLWDVLDRPMMSDGTVRLVHM